MEGGLYGKECVVCISDVIKVKIYLKCDEVKE